MSGLIYVWGGLPVITHLSAEFRALTASGGLLCELLYPHWFTQEWRSVDGKCLEVSIAGCL